MSDIPPPGTTASMNVNSESTTQSSVTNDKHRLEEHHELTYLLGKLEKTTDSIRQAFEGQAPHHPKHAPRLGPIITKRLLLLTFVWQIINVGILTILDATVGDETLKLHNLDDRFLMSGIVVMAVFQLVQMLLIVAASVKLAKQLVHHTASSSFLAQSYMSTILLFAGIYTLLHRCDQEAWYGVTTQERFDKTTYILNTFILFFYFSTSTMTSVGYGDIHPRSWYLYLLTSSQMLLGVMYSVAILGRGIEVLAPGAMISKADRKKEKKKKIVSEEEV
eukprot:m.180296 g.180296  ORF g.180296 m.180296 type:complete len:277 (+) comp15496_c0_seq2:427-1257(+)